MAEAVTTKPRVFTLRWKIRRNLAGRRRYPSEFSTGFPDFFFFFSFSRFRNPKCEDRGVQRSEPLGLGVVLATERFNALPRLGPNLKGALRSNTKR